MAGTHEIEDDSETRTPGRRLLRTRQDVENRRRRLVTYACLLGSVVLLVDALVGDNGYLAKLRSGRENATLKAELARLQDDNLRLAEQASRLRHDPDAIEEAARHDLSLMKPGEVLVIVRDTPGAGPR